jgi:hypothetical protein
VSRCGKIGYSIASSAPASNIAGTVIPSDLAVFRFTLNTSLVDCSTGKFARLCAFQEAVHVDGGPPILVGYIWPVRHQVRVTCCSRPTWEPPATRTTSRANADNSVALPGV